MKMVRTLRRMALGAAACLFAMSSLAESFPSKPVRIISSAPPGGGMDTSLRILTAELSKMWGQPIVIEPKPGASGLIAQQAVMASPADGYTLGMQGLGFMTIITLAHGEKYSNVTAVVPVAMISEYPLALAVSASSSYNSWQDLAAEAKRREGALPYGIPGVGTSPHLVGELFQQAAKVKMNAIPYKGDAAMLTDLMGGQVQAGFPIMTSALSYAKSGRIKLLGVVSSSRVPAAPDLPTLQEQGMDVVMAPYNSLISPLGTPPEIVTKIIRDISTVLKLPQVQKFFLDNALIARDLTPEQMLVKVKSDMEIGHRLIRELKIPVN